MMTSSLDMEGQGNYTLSKDERLAGRNDIERLFARGEAFLVYPVKCTYFFHIGGDNRVVFIVPKRNHKRAVTRNLLKRRLREAYRQHKSLLFLPEKCSVASADLAFSYVAQGKPLDYRIIELAIISILTKLCAIRKRQENTAAKRVPNVIE